MDLNSLPDPHQNRRNIGLGLMAAAAFLASGPLCCVFGLMPAFEEHSTKAYQGIALGALLAFPAGALYLTVPRLLDRYDPEPWYALVGCLLWGAIVSCGFSLVINTAVGAFLGETIGAVVCAPIVEEFWKGLAVFGVFYFLRREFDGVVDGIIYATFTAIGFATVENVLYYADAEAASQEQLAQVFVLRGILGPWGHPLYTSMTGIGLGIARETTKPALRWLAPIGGYMAAVLLHALWNGVATFAGAAGEAGAGIFVCMLPLWLLFVAGFGVILVVLVRRRGRIIRQHLLDEVAMKTIDQAELELVCSPFGTFTARMRYGRLGEEFVRAVARLALSKWHVGRAVNAKKHTVSYGFVIPLRERIAQLKQQRRGGQ